MLEGRECPSLFLADGGSELEGLDDEDWRAALTWGARARGSPDLMSWVFFKIAIQYLIVDVKLENQNTPSKGGASRPRDKVWTRSSTPGVIT